MASSDAAGLFDRRPFRAPSLTLFALEQRGLFELGAMLAASPFLRAVGRGDRHPVLVLPGFTTSDSAMRPMRWFLRGQGYWVHGWGLGSNVGPTPEVVAGLTERLVSLHARHGVKVSLVGISLGGIFARELARLHPAAVRQVITLGSPFRLRPRPGDRSNVSYLYERLAYRYVSMTDDADVEEDERAPLEMPVTSIYSRSDGVAPWSACLEVASGQRENIEVQSSHSGLAVHPAALMAVADRLALPEDSWTPFRPRRGFAWWYPTPASYDPRRRAVAG